jgi:hypothetical protein
MPRTESKKCYTARDIWQAYARQLLAKNPTWWTSYHQVLKCSNYAVGYIDASGKKIEVMNYTRFRKILEFYFDRAKTAIIQGEAISMRAKVGKICIKRVQRDFRKGRQRKVDWKKTNAQPKVWSEKSQKMVPAKIIYHTGNEWFRVGWAKNHMLPNESVYEFTPTSSNSGRTAGFKLELSTAIGADPFLKYKYLYSPFNIKARTV